MDRSDCKKMTDVFSPQKRSQIMKAVKSKENKSTELKLIKIFRENEIKGWRRNYKVLGKPDFVFLKAKVAVFTDGCFWHGHNCRNLNPSTNKSYWEKKISRNIQRDIDTTKRFEKKGWKVLRIWECELVKKKYFDKIILLKTYLSA